MIIDSIDRRWLIEFLSLIINQIMNKKCFCITRQPLPDAICKANKIIDPPRLPLVDLGGRNHKTIVNRVTKEEKLLIFRILYPGLPAL